MFLKNISVANFRNYSKQKFDFKNSITILLGDNAQGKSNFLEAIYFLANAKSQKASEDIELIKEREDFLKVEGIADGVHLEVAIQNLDGEFKKRIKINGIPKRVSDYSENLAVVLFSPEDINLVTGSPNLRRNYINLAISQIDKAYKKILSSYENVIIRKNKVLKKIKEGFGREDELLFWTDQQILLGAVLTEKRKNFFDFINNAETKFGQFKFIYRGNVVSKERLREYQAKEIEAAGSLIGPQRDDFDFYLEGMNLSRFGSRGERRTAVLDLKMAELSFIEDVLKSRPLLLLDDIFSELDDLHKMHVLSLTKLQQTIIASVELDPHLKNKFKDAAMIYVENGKLIGTVGK